ncbi:hypothetical protein AB3S75_008766 [Citrus x aurantiifolia]
MEFKWPGCVPEFGAIFMSNTGTKEECFRRKLLGLPSGLVPFVKQIKAGMILFLFEYERRELHGVYQASSDGAMNILPHAYFSSGKQFPAQVKFTHLWHCSPLSEHEFGEAIKENYYSAKKFNFGLSEVQVHRLLYLFSLKKIKPQTHFSRCKAPGYSMDKFRRAAEDRSITSTQGEDERDADSSHGSVISTDHFGARLGSGGRVIHDYRLPSDSSVHCQFEPSSAFCRPMEPHATNCLPNDPEGPVIHAVPYTEPRGARCPDFCSALGCGAPIPSPKLYRNSQGIRMPSLEASYSGNMATNPSEIEGHRGFSLPRPSPVPFSDGGNCNGMNVGAYSFSPSQYPSFVFNYGCHEASLDKNDQKPLQFGINLKEGRSQLQGPFDPVKFSNTDLHDSSSLKPDVCQNSGIMYSDCQKNRKSVFSRLALAPKACIRENDTIVRVDEDSMDTSVDDVMSMLHQSHYQWLKMRKDRQLIKLDTADFRKKRKTAPDSKLLKDHFKKISDEVSMNDITANEEISDQLAGKTPFVDFKRRSEMRKSHDGDSKIGGCGWRAETGGCADGLQKKRKLIRPDFSKNQLIDDKSINVDTQKIEQLCVLSHVGYIVEAERVSNCEVEETVETCGPTFSNVIQVGKELSKNVDIRSIPSSISVEEPTNKGSLVDGLFQDRNHSTHSFEQESSLEACERSHNGVASGEIECSRNIQELDSNANLDGANDVDIPTNKDSLVDGLFQDLNGSTHSFEQESLLEACERSHYGIASGEIECSRNIQESDSNANLDGANDVDLVNESDNQATKSERVCEEVIASRCKGCKVDILRNDDDKNSVLSSEGEIITGQYQTI